MACCCSVKKIKGGFGMQVLRLAGAIGTGWRCRALHIAALDTNPRAFAFRKREGFVELLRDLGMDYAGHAIAMERALPNDKII
jgi:hypothetical protein